MADAGSSQKINHYIPPFARNSVTPHGARSDLENLVKLEGLESIDDQSKRDRIIREVIDNLVRRYSKVDDRDNLKILGNIGRKDCLFFADKTPYFYKEVEFATETDVEDYGKIMARIVKQYNAAAMLYNKNIVERHIEKRRSDIYNNVIRDSERLRIISSCGGS